MTKLIKNYLSVNSHEHYGYWETCAFRHQSSVFERWEIDPLVFLEYVMGGVEILHPQSTTLVGENILA